MRRLRLLGGHWSRSRGSTSHVMRIFGWDWIEKSHQRIKLTPLFGRLLVFAFIELIFLFQKARCTTLKNSKVKYHVIIDVIWHSPLRKWLCKWKNEVISEKTSASWVFPQQNHTLFHPRESKFYTRLVISVAYANISILECYY